MAEMSFKRAVWIETLSTDADLARRSVGRARAHVPNGKYHGVKKITQILKTA